MSTEGKLEFFAIAFGITIICFFIGFVLSKTYFKQWQNKSFFFCAMHAATIGGLLVPVALLLFGLITFIYASWADLSATLSVAPVLIGVSIFIIPIVFLPCFIFLFLAYNLRRETDLVIPPLIVIICVIIVSFLVGSNAPYVNWLCVTLFSLYCMQRIFKADRLWIICGLIFNTLIIQYAILYSLVNQMEQWE